MAKKATSIPVNRFGDESDSGVFIEKIAFKNLPDFAEWGQPERHDRHSFFLLEKGSVTIEIDFKKYKIIPSSVIYMHPSQVHRIVAFKNVTVNTWAIDNENIHPDYLKLLEEITPTKPMVLNKETYSIVMDAVTLCLKFSKQKNNKLHHSFLKDGCNALIALVVSQYLEKAKPTERFSRAEVVAKSFREKLEYNFTEVKSPGSYAQKLNISTAYLNECIKNTTGYPVSYHIQQRIVLEAKRLLCHTDKSIKEIATELGYEDYHYFSRLFSKVAGMAALTFRNKNHD